MDIRTITFGIKKGQITPRTIAGVNEIVEGAQKQVRSHGNTIVTLRLVSAPFVVNDRTPLEEVESFFEAFEQLRRELSFNWFCIPIRFESIPEEGTIPAIISAMLQKYDNSFSSVVIDDDSEISDRILHSCGKIIKRISRIDQSGLANFRFGYSFFVKSHTPYFPFTFHEGKPGFSVSYELVQPILDIIQTHRKDDAAALRRRLVSSLVNSSRADILYFRKMNRKTNLGFYGVDFSLAPMPDLGLSVHEIVTELNGALGGNRGNLFLTHYITSILKQVAKESGHPAGFNGVMYSILEDKGFCRQNNKKPIQIDSLLAYSTLCGCGLDMIPIPGNIQDEKLVQLATEVHTLAKKFNKPLGCRLVPVPGRIRNEKTDFHHPFLANTRIFDL